MIRRDVKHPQPIGACAQHTTILYQEGCISRDHTSYVCGVAATVYWRERGPQHFSQKLDSGDNGELQGSLEVDNHLCMEKARGYLWSYLIRSLALAWATLAWGFKRGLVIILYAS